MTDCILWHCSYPPLNRWIQREANSQHLSDSPILSSCKLSDNFENKEEKRASLKRPRPKEDMDSLSDREEEDAPSSSRFPSSVVTWDDDSLSPGLDNLNSVSTGTKVSKDLDLRGSYSLMFDWENEAPFAEAVQR